MAANTALREDVLQSATKFLQDPKVQSAALAKKVAFLESKGLTNDEIEEALARSSGKSTQNATGAVVAGQQQPQQQQQYYQGYPPQQGYMPGPGVAVGPPRPKMDWKDYFIAAVVFGGVSYGVFELTKVRRKLRTRGRRIVAPDSAFL